IQTEVLGNLKTLKPIPCEALAAGITRLQTDLPSPDSVFNADVAQVLAAVQPILTNCNAYDIGIESGAGPFPAAEAIRRAATDALGPFQLAMERYRQR